MKKRQLTFISTQLGLTDYLSWNDNNTFADLIQNIKNKYESQVKKYIFKNFQNIRKNISLNDITIKLYYVSDGEIISIGNFSKVSEIIQKGIHRIYWDPEPIGGI